MKACSKCKVDKYLDQFDLKYGQPRSICKSCVSEYTKAYYRKHKVAIIKRNRQLTIKARTTNRQKLLDLLIGKACMDCGEKDPVVLEFDHLRDKTAGIATVVRLGWSWKRIMEEVEKCEIVCANCHRKRTAKRSKWFKYQPAVA